HEEVGPELAGLAAQDLDRGPFQGLALGLVAVEREEADGPQLREQDQVAPPRLVEQGEDVPERLLLRPVLDFQLHAGDTHGRRPSWSLPRRYCLVVSRWPRTACTARLRSSRRSASRIPRCSRITSWNLPGWASALMPKRDR